MRVAFFFNVLAFSGVSVFSVRLTIWAVRLMRNSFTSVLHIEVCQRPRLNPTVHTFNSVRVSKHVNTTNDRSEYVICCSYINRYISNINGRYTIHIIGQLPRVSGKDPERIRVDSVIETFTCVFCVLCLSSNFLIFPLSAFSFYTVQYRRVQYSTGIYLVPRYYSVV